MPSFQSFILATPDALSRRQLAEIFGRSPETIYHWREGEGSAQVDDCIRAFPHLPAEMQDRFLSLFARRDGDVDGEPMRYAASALRLMAELMISIEPAGRDPFYRIDDAAALAHAIRRTVDCAIVAARRHVILEGRMRG